MVRQYWKGQNACVFELLIEQECLSGESFPWFFRAGAERAGKGGEGRAAPFRHLFSSAPEMNFELAAAGEKEHE